jgi:predicted porin
MKKSLVALAVLAASGAAMAQSTVTLYGLADIYFGTIKKDPGVTQTVLNSGAVNGSRWGMKGSEDLGGGLKANFQLESGFNIDDGTQGQGRLFGRQSWVGFSGGFGAVKLGRMPTAYDDVNGNADAVFDSALSAMQHVFRSYNADFKGYTIRTNNTIKYESANMSGFSGAVDYSLGENKDVTPGVGAGSVTAFNLAYAAGPLALSLAYQTEKQTGNAVAVNNTRLNAAYDFGVATVKAAYGIAKNVAVASNAVAPEFYIAGKDGTEATEWQLGADFPVSAALKLSANYAKSDDNATLGNASRKGVGLGAAYTLSKRTFLYGGYTNAKSSGSTVAGVVDSTVSILGVGVQHRF